MNRRSLLAGLAASVVGLLAPKGGMAATGAVALLLEPSPARLAGETIIIRACDVQLVGTVTMTEILSERPKLPPAPPVARK